MREGLTPHSSASPPASSLFRSGLFWGSHCAAARAVTLANAHTFPSHGRARSFLLVERSDNSKRARLSCPRQTACQMATAYEMARDGM